LLKRCQFWLLIDILLPINLYTPTVMLLSRSGILES
jgi:hypothetical protein